MEVAFAGARELFAWPGDEYFVSESPASLAGGGLGSSGEFISHLRSVFRAPGASILPAPQGSQGKDARLLRYDYRIPAFGSGFTITGLGGSATVASAGSFWADAESLDIVSLVSRAVDVPAQTGLSEVAQTTYYAPVTIHGVGRLMPQRATSATVDFAGAINRNHIEFSHCREFTASSELTFTEGSFPERNPSVRVAVPSSVKTRLPPRLTIRIRLDPAGEAGAAKLATAHAGLTLSGTLVEAVKHRGRELAPAGAPVNGRLRWIEKRPEGWMIGIEFTTIHTAAPPAGEPVRLLATLTSIHDPTGAAQLRVQRRRHERVLISKQMLPHLTMIDTYQEEESVELLSLPGVGFLTLSPGAAEFPRGLELSWLTDP